MSLYGNRTGARSAGPVTGWRDAALGAWVALVVTRAPRARRHDDRGDVNGYVFVTLMTAGIVMVIWVVARDRLSDIFNRAITSVTGP